LQGLGRLLLLQLFSLLWRSISSSIGEIARHKKLSLPLVFGLVLDAERALILIAEYIPDCSRGIVDETVYSDFIGSGDCK